MIEAAYQQLEPLVGVRGACLATGRSRATHYRRRQVATRPARPRASRGAPSNALTPAERERILALLRSPRFVDASPAQAWATLLDEGTYLASLSSFYRLLRAGGEVRERRRQASHPPRTRPELVATAPNQVWSWDITKLKGPGRGDWYSLYVIIDIFSRYLPGWCIAPVESAEIATALIGRSVAEQRIESDQLAIHADRGSPMTSHGVAELLAELGVTQSHSRPQVSNDNPYSEAQFKTLKYCPAFPERFGSIQDARSFCERFVEHYNHAHRHSGIGLHTPASVHYGTATAIRGERQGVLEAAYQAHPERFGAGPPRPPALPTQAWINDPARQPAPPASAGDRAASLNR